MTGPTDPFTGGSWDPDVDAYIPGRSPVGRDGRGESGYVLPAGAEPFSDAYRVGVPPGRRLGTTGAAGAGALLLAAAGGAVVTTALGLLVLLLGGVLVAVVVGSAVLVGACALVSAVLRGAR